MTQSEHKENTELIAKLEARLSSPVGSWKTTQVAECVWVLSGGPFLASGEGSSGNIDLTVGAVTHGNEVVGLGTVDEFLDFLEPQKPSCTIAFFLGNPKACKLGMRYTERDLNRSFSAREGDTDWRPALYEELRAVELQKVLLRTKVLIDLHQTKCPSESAFWVLQMTPEHYRWARSIDPKSPFVCYDGMFSADGDGTAEYVRRKGGIALTIESGQEGLEPSQVEFMLAKLKTAFELLTGSREFAQPDVGKDELLYTWDQTIPNSPNSHLVPGLKNFSVVKKDSVYGYKGQEPLIAQNTAMSLFPKYPRTDVVSEPTELIRFLKKYQPTS